MMSFGIGAWFSAHWHLTSARQQEISHALKQAHEQNQLATQRNIAASEDMIEAPPPSAKASIDSLLGQICRKRKARREPPHS